MDYINEHIEYEKICEKYGEKPIWKKPAHANAQGYIEGDPIKKINIFERIKNYGRRKTNRKNV
jgi:hypothetical protein